jgi:hypothetical protein
VYVKKYFTQSSRRQSAKFVKGICGLNAILLRSLRELLEDRRVIISDRQSVFKDFNEIKFKTSAFLSLNISEPSRELI